MRNLFVSVSLCCMVGGLVACGGEGSYTLTSSELSGELASIYATQFSKKEIEYCGPAYVHGSMHESKIDDLPEYNQLPRKVKKSVDRWVGAHNLKTGKKIPLNSFVKKANSKLVKFIVGENSSIKSINEELLTRCETAGLDKQFDSVAKALEGKK